jgi:hypothetical protein
MTDLAAEATLWNGLKLVLQLLALITVKACGFMLSVSELSVFVRN